MAWQNTPRGGCIRTVGDRRSRVATGETAGAETAPPLIHYIILTPVETLILVVVLAGAVIVVGIPIGILVLFKILARILTLAKTLLWRESKSRTGR